jgi:hypothetical protein
VEDWKSAEPFDVGKFAPQTQPATESLDIVLQKAGASLKRDAVDTRVVKDVTQHGGKLLDSQEQVGGWPILQPAVAPLDTDQDGMPDAWESAHGLDARNSNDGNADANGDGYTNLEDYLNSLAP